jgi:hypothetical protein
MDTAANKLVGFLNEGFGQRATQYLKDGASFKLVVGEHPYSLAKSEGKMILNEGEPGNYEVLLEYSPAAIDYLTGAGTVEDSMERLGEVAHSPTSDRYARMRIEMAPTEKSRVDFYWKGYFFWARRMGFVA